MLWDDNNITIDGTVELSDRTDQLQRFKASGWHVQAIDGHDPIAIDEALAAARKSKKPSMIACKTHIALGHAAQDTSKGHGALTDAGQCAKVLRQAFFDVAFYGPCNHRRGAFGANGHDDRIAVNNRGGDKL